MQYRRLGRTEIDVSLLCIGSMNWGSNNTEAEGHAQMDKAVDHGVNFIDTAEMYAVPPSEETYGNSERVIGTWMKARGNRDKVIIASKVAGPDGITRVLRSRQRDQARHSASAAGHAGCRHGKMKEPP